MNTGIIGSADGPVAVFISWNPKALILSVVVIAAIITGIVIFIAKRKK